MLHQFTEYGKVAIQGCSIKHHTVKSSPRCAIRLIREVNR